jgi:tetratricopeptide (TPR) repeat protein
MGIVERTSGRLNEALRVYNEAATLFDHVRDDLLTGHFHHAFANALKHIVQAEKREDHADRAFMEYTAASYHFERAGHIRYQACVENNIGSLLGIIGKYEDAHEHLDRAQVIMTRLKDNVHLGQVDETRSRVLLAEGRTVEAEKTARHGITLARLDHADQALGSLQRAIGLAEQVGDFESAGESALTIIEVLGANLSDEEVLATINHAGVLLEKTQEATTLKRLATAFRLLVVTRAVATPPDWEGFSFKDAVHRYEARLIRLALKETGGKVTAAARLLGFSHHQSLIALIGSRHKELLEMRSPVRARRHHLLEHPKRKRKQQ